MSLFGFPTTLCVAFFCNLPGLITFGGRLVMMKMTAAMQIPPWGR